MADSVQGDGSNSGESGKQERRRPCVTPAAAAELGRRAAAYGHARAYSHAVTFAHLRDYTLLAVKGSGLVALLLSTVILLGGYVQSLGKQDFFCIMAITVIQAAGIFQDWRTNLEYLAEFVGIFANAVDILDAHTHALALLELLFAVLYVLILCVLLFYVFGPLACAVISSWRIAKLNNDNTYRQGTTGDNMMAALNIFYSLIIFQGTMSLVLLLPIGMYLSVVVRRLLQLEQLSDNKWGKDAIQRYIYDIGLKCRKDTLSIKGMDLIKYSAELLDSESQEDYLYGARLLSAFVNKGEDVSWVLLPSRHRIQRLIDSLMISSSSYRLDEACVQLKSQSRHGRCYAVIGGLDDKKEMRELAATIVAHVAFHIDDLSNYPGAMRCISSLFQDQEETNQTYRNRDNKQVPGPPLLQRLIGLLTKQEHRQEERIRKEREKKEEMYVQLMKEQKRMADREHRHRNRREGGTTNKLVQQGLTIIERLASNSDDNRRLICGASGLLPKITAPVYSATLIEDVKTKAWADIVTRCLKVLHQLIRSSDGSHEIFSNNAQALSNLKSILELGSNNEAEHRELQLVAMKILTELALDLSINLSEEIKKVLVTKLLQLFLPANGDNGEEESAAIAMAGRTLVSLSTNSDGNSDLIMTTQNGTIGRLTGILDDENITHRTIAAEVMANLFAHCNVDNTTKEILRKVLKKIMLLKTKSQQSKISGGQNVPAATGDEENQRNSVSTTTNNEGHTETEEICDQEREVQEAFLSLAQVICNKLSSADLEGAIQSAVDQNNGGSEKQRREAFVDKLKTIIDDNCKPAADSLRIVKLCAQIAKSVMRCEQYAEIFKNRGFKSSLSKASETMTELESCMRFVGTDFGLRKTVRPLLSEIEKTWPAM